MATSEYTRGYNAGYRAGLRYREGKSAGPLVVSPKSRDAHDPEATYAFMVRYCPDRGGYMFEGALPAYERGEYKDAALDELLRRGWIKPHDDPDKGWVPVVPKP